MILLKNTNSNMKIRFTTEEGIEGPAVTKRQMIEIDRIAIEETGPNLFQMMENAGRNCRRNRKIKSGDLKILLSR